MTDPARHAARHAAAAATIITPTFPALSRAVVHADGRIAYPSVVRYQLMRWDEAAEVYAEGELVDLPPTEESHPDEHAADLARRCGQQPRACTVPYRVVVQPGQLATYEHLKARGSLDIGHRTSPRAVRQPVDRRAAPGA